MTLAVASGAILLVLYAVFPAQERFVVRWAPFVASFAYLAVRFRPRPRTHRVGGGAVAEEPE